MNEQKLTLEIENLIRESIDNYFQKKRKKTAHVLDYIFPVERQIYSTMNGLVTSMGTSFWEKLVDFLAKQNHFEILKKQDKKLLKPNPFPKSLRDELSELKNLRKTSGTWLSMSECIERLRQIATNIDNREALKFINPPSGHGVDIYFIKNQKEYVFDLKNTYPNRGDGARFNDQLLDWYSYRLSKDPFVEIEARIVIPFNPFLPQT